MSAIKPRKRASVLHNSDVRAAVCQAVRDGAPRSVALTLAGYKRSVKDALKVCRNNGFHELAGLLDGTDSTWRPDPNTAEIVVKRAGILQKAWTVIDRTVEFGTATSVQFSAAKWAIERYEPAPEHTPDNDSDELWEHVYELEQEGRDALAADTNPE